MYQLSDIKTLHLEMTEKCQAGCPFCPRHLEDGSLNPNMIDAELSLFDCKKYFSKKFVRQLKKALLCGNYGDPIIANDTLEVLEHFRYNNPRMSLDVHTNGGARTKIWWKDLASLLYNDNSQVIFSIDGLQDTNHIYRKHVNWNKVMDSAEAFIEAGGNAVWSFLVFRHNEHQVDEAKRMSEKMGFRKFVAKKSARFATSKAKNKTDLLPPLNEQYQNKNLKAIAEIANTYGTIEEFYNQTKINCMVANEKSIYVSARGLLFPCCWLGGVHDQRNDLQLHKLIGSFDRIDLNKKTIQEVFDSGLFEDIKKTWSCSSTSEGKLRTCSKMCSSEFNFFKAQFE